jgi:hypothetical protein
MPFLKQNDVLGQLAEERLFVYYDGPRLFIAENPAGQKYLVNCLDSDEFGSEWLLTAISERRLFALTDGKVSLREAFTRPEISTVFRLKTSLDGDFREIQRLQPSELSDEELPSPGVLLQVEEARTHPNAAFLARSLNATVILLHLFPGRKAVEAPARKVGRILTSLQDYVSEKIAQFLPADPDGLQQYDLNMVGTFAGSFGVELAIHGDDPRIADALKDAVEVIGAAEEIDTFKEQMQGIEDSEVAALRKFLLEMQNAESDLKLEAASYNDPSPTTVDVALPRIRAAVKSLSRPPKIRQLSKTAVVELIAINVRTRRFEVEIVDTKEAIKGAITASIFKELRTLELPRRYRVVLEADVRQSGSRPEELSHWRMVSATKL